MRSARDGVPDADVRMHSRGLSGGVLRSRIPPVGARLGAAGGGRSGRGRIGSYSPLLSRRPARPLIGEIVGGHEALGDLTDTDEVGGSWEPQAVPIVVDGLFRRDAGRLGELSRGQLHRPQVFI